LQSIPDRPGYRISQINMQQRAEDHTKQLIPAIKMFNILVAVILSNKIVKYSLWKKFNNLRENIFAFVHGSGI